MRIISLPSGDQIPVSLEPMRRNAHLGPLRSARPHRVAVVAATEPAAQAAGVLQALGCTSGRPPASP